MTEDVRVPQLAGRVAIVTGAGYPAGIGRAIAIALARNGADVATADLNLEGATAIAEEIRSMGRRSVAVRTDVSKEDQVNSLVATVLDEFGRVDVLVNNAGVARYGQVLDVSAEEWDWVLGVNLKGAFLCTRAVLPSMMRQHAGRIVCISSITGRRGGGLRTGPHYAASKAGLIGFAKTVARQVAAHGVTCNVVAPGYVDTDISRGVESPEQRGERRERARKAIPLERLATPRDIAESVAFLASDEASYITGAVLDVDGGATLSPV